MKHSISISKEIYLTEMYSLTVLRFDCDVPVSGSTILSSFSLSDKLINWSKDTSLLVTYGPSLQS